MRLLSWFFGSPRPNPAYTQLHPLQSQTAADSPASNRRELLRAALRDALVKHGIPLAWVSVEMLTATGRGRELGIHLRLLVKHWDPRLLVHGVAFEKSFLKQVAIIDPMAVNWLNGISWQFALADESACPAMPDVGTWTAPPVNAKARLDQMFANESGPSGRTGNPLASADDADRPPHSAFRPTVPAQLR